MKIHFAGNDNNQANKDLFNTGIRYRLNSYHYLKKHKQFDYMFLDQYNHSIVDSGLFTIMFGSDKSGKKKYETFADFYEYMIKYCDWINQYDWKNTSFVECDVQKKLSSETAWEFRKEMKAKVKKGLIINVYHLEDENPDRLIDHADYIAISLPELRFNLSDKERWNLTKYIATKATLKGKRVHLLGCTEKKYLEYFSFLFSCDSTSWTSPFRYGEVVTKQYKTKVSILEEVKQSKDVRSLCALLYKLDYQRQSGSQD